MFSFTISVLNFCSHYILEMMDFDLHKLNSDLKEVILNDKNSFNLILQNTILFPINQEEIEVIEADFYKKVDKIPTEM